MHSLATCSTCAETKPTTEFYADKSKANGRTSDCKPCNRQRSRERYRRNNPGAQPATRQPETAEERQARTRRLAREQQARRRARLRAQGLNQQGEPLALNTTRECSGCHTAFSAQSHNHTYCSRTCKSRAAAREHTGSWNTDRQRADRYGVHYEHVDRPTVYERDEWTCGLCRQPIDRTLQYPHGMSVSLDHVIPLAHGGPHTYSNVQAAHLRCNREAGSRIAAGHRQLVMPRELSGPRPS